MSDWIKCSDRLPEESENVILYDGLTVFCGNLGVRKDKTIYVGMQGCDGVCYGWCNKEKVTHWMPLPSTDSIEEKQ